MPLYDILNEFQKGHSHIAVVYKDLNEKKEISNKGKGAEQLEFKDSCKKHRGKSEASPNKGEDVRSTNRRILSIFYPIVVLATGNGCVRPVFVDGRVPPVTCDYTIQERFLPTLFLIFRVQTCLHLIYNFDT